MLDDKSLLASKYAAKKAISKDIRTDALAYVIRNRNVLESHLRFQGSEEKKFKESLINAV